LESNLQFKPFYEFTVRCMRQYRGVLSVMAVVSLFVLAACSGPLFDPAGTYVGTLTDGTTTANVSVVVTQASGSTTSWDVTLSGSGSSYTGTCTHDTSTSAEDLTCSLDIGGTPITMEGDVHNNTWSGTITQTGVTTTLTFTVTRS